MAGPRNKIVNMFLDMMEDYKSTTAASGDDKGLGAFSLKLHFAPCLLIKILLGISIWTITSAATTMDAESLLRGDKLILRGLLFHGFHGVNPEERISGQKFMVDIDAWMDLRAAGNSDNLSDSVSYTDIYQ
ncbi:hypothetical protein PIB30_047587 [Stylosanthes scabra]|uniref:dihydroneopterin aldolase n=1 Tax=Stylosanthes scabra TaxID=79078 RepID=A0ABU6YII7_9FABA|nr:hypothetical protein [Stylosanthes scabra]